MISHFDHAFMFAPHDAATTVAWLQAAGFLANLEDGVQHAGGQLNVFALLTGSYLEFMTIADEAEFQRSSSPVEQLYRQALRPFGVVAFTNDADEVFAKLEPQCAGLAPVARSAPADAPETPFWAILKIPEPTVPGVQVSVLQYLFPIPKASVRCSPNSIYAFGGFWFCSEANEPARVSWLRLLGQLAPEVQVNGNICNVGPQQLRWISPAEHEALLGRVWVPPPSSIGAICALRLLCESKATVEQWLRKAGVEFASLDATTLVVHAFGDIIFVIEEVGSGAEFAAYVNRYRKVTKL